MSIRTATAIALVIFALGACFWLFVRPVIVKPELELVEESQLIYMGEDEAGEHGYLLLKEEVKEWSKILANFVPLLSLLAAYLLRKKK